METKGNKSQTTVRAVFLTIALCFAVIEIFFTTVYWIETREVIWARSIKRQPESGSALPTIMILDPYLGYTFRTGYNHSDWPSWRDVGYESPPDWMFWRANNYGFLEDRDYPVQTVAGRDFVVGIFGSSVAQGLALQGRPAIIKYLQSNPALHGRNIIILDYAVGGYKQPQQLLTLSYFAALGQHFDLIVNMDGSTSGYIGWENVTRYHVDPFMPTARFIYGLQNYLVSANANEATETARARVAELDELLDRARSGAWYYLLAAIRDGIQQRRAEALTENAKVISGRQYAIRMKATEQDFSQNIDRIAELWARSSLEMAGIADRIGATYVHLLEPNPWLGRKPLSAEERSLLAAPREPMSDIIPPLYNAFFTESVRLRTMVNFLDGTRAFEGHEETLYRDYCCHFNLPGHNLLVENVLGPWLQTFTPARGAKNAETR